ncbi:MAG: MgtC/SapB family protein [Candidatus Thorarchaeota archaeon]|nr:MgtC/SapB family protein [Candidatus Thorarchaeota archaeon]
MQNAIDFLSADLVLRLIIGFAVGGLIGLERQKKLEQDRTVGVRSFGLHSLLGTLASYSFVVSGNPIILVYATAISLLLVGIQLYQKIIRSMRKGMTTTIVFAMAYVLGTLVGLDVPPEGQLVGTLQILAMTVAFMVFLVLGFKDELAAAVAGVSHDEMISAAELGVVILFFWPLIPETIPVPGLTDGFPIFTTYILIVILLSISFANYLLVKKYKERGKYFFGFFGGFANSEATVSSLTETYVKTGRKNPGSFAVSTIFANLAMVLRNGILVILLDPTFQIFGYYLIPLSLLIVVGLIRLLYERRKFKHEEEPEELDTKLVSPFEFGAALRFAAVFGFILYISLVAQALASDAGFLIVSVIGGLINAGAVVTTAALTFTAGGISLATAVYSVIIATTMALMNKIIFVYQADRETTLARLVLRDGLIMAVGVVIYIILLSSGTIPIA